MIHARSSASSRHISWRPAGVVAALAASRGSTESAVRQALHRLKREFRTILRETIAETVERPEDVEDELRYLLRAISQPT
jgi:RNA polymerase sigma-70 factor (ECF subfamily)